jgi:NTP pyrophosphatase (non-canonical NTP hydrolase)
MEEVGELSRIMVRMYGEQSFKESEQHLNHKEKLADEMADVLWVLTALANQCDIKLEEAMQKNIEKKTLRDATRHQENTKL